MESRVAFVEEKIIGNVVDIDNGVLDIDMRVVVRSHKYCRRRRGLNTILKII